MTWVGGPAVVVRLGVVAGALSLLLSSVMAGSTEAGEWASEESVVARLGRGVGVVANGGGGDAAGSGAGGAEWVSG